jgi:hypothetical protein
VSATAGANYVLEEYADAGYTQILNTYWTGTGTAFPVSGKTNGTYYYRVKAYLGGYQDSGWINGAYGCVVNVSSSAPSWISVRTSTTDGTTGVGWGASSTPSVTYIVQESTDPAFLNNVQQVYSGFGTSVQLPGHLNGTYYYRVKAVESGYNDSAWKLGANGCVVTLSPLTAPSWISVRAASTDGTAGVAWGSSTAAGVTYIVQESTDSAFFSNVQQVYSGTGTSMLLPGHLNGTYYYRVKAVEAGYTDSAWIAGANGCVVTLSPLPAPTYIVVRTSSNTGETGAGWGTSPATGVTYILQESTDALFSTNVQQVYSGIGTSVVLPGHLSGTYFYRVKVVKPGYTDSAWVVGANGCVVAALPAPTYVSVRATSNSGETGIGWGASPAPGVTYIVQESTDPTFMSNVQQVYSGTDTSVHPTGRLNGTYYYRVKAVIPGYIDSAWVVGTNGCVVNLLPLPAPSWISVRAASSDGTTGVGWGTSTAAGVTYVVQESTDSMFLSNVQEVYRGTGTSIHPTGRLSGTYYYRVKAIESGYTDSVWVKGFNGCVVNVP